MLIDAFHTINIIIALFHSTFLNTLDFFFTLTGRFTVVVFPGKAYLGGIWSRGARDGLGRRTGLQDDGRGCSCGGHLGALNSRGGGDFSSFAGPLALLLGCYSVMS